MRRSPLVWKGNHALWSSFVICLQPQCHCLQRKSDKPEPSVVGWPWPVAKPQPGVGSLLYSNMGERIKRAEVRKSFVRNKEGLDAVQALLSDSSKFGLSSELLQSCTWNTTPFRLLWGKFTATIPCTFCPWQSPNFVTSLLTESVGSTCFLRKWTLALILLLS